MFVSVLFRVSLLAQMVKDLPAMPKTWFWSLCWEDHLEKAMATHSSIFAQRIPKSLVGYSRWGHKESDRTEQLTLSLSSLMFMDPFFPLVHIFPLISLCWYLERSFFLEETWVRILCGRRLHLQPGWLKLKVDWLGPGAHWTFMPRRPWQEWRLYPWRLGLSPSLTTALSHGCFILSSRCWQDGSQQHQVSVLPSSCFLARCRLQLNDCTAMDGELRLWFLIHWWPRPKPYAHLAGKEGEENSVPSRARRGLSGRKVVTSQGKYAKSVIGGRVNRCGTVAERTEVHFREWIKPFFFFCS